MTAALRAWLAALAATVGLTGCMFSSDDVDGEEAARTLEAQRDEVRAEMKSLVERSVSALPGRVSNAIGRFEGCESRFNDKYQNFRYSASARIDVRSGVARPYLDAVATALEASGFTNVEPGERPGGATLGGTKGELSATVSELPDQGAYVLLGVSGPCVDVPADQSDDWLGREDSTPIVE